MQQPAYPPPGTWPAPPAAPQPPAPQFTSGGAPVTARPRTIASLLPRFAAALIDVLIVGLLSFPIRAVIALAGIFVAGDSEGNGFLFTVDPGVSAGSLVISAIDLLVVAASWVLYSGLTTARGGARRGQTFGKQIAGVAITSARGGAPISARRGWLRAIVFAAALAGPLVAGFLLDAITGWTPIGSTVGAVLCLLTLGLMLATALAGQQRRMVHDRLTQTAVATAGEGEPMPLATSARTWILSLLTALLLLGLAIAHVAGAIHERGEPASIADTAVAGESQGAAAAGASGEGSGAPGSNSTASSGSGSGGSDAERIMAEPANAAAISGLRAITDDLTECMAARSARDCRVALHLRLRELTFVEAGSFDMERADEVAEHVGEFSALAGDDGTMFVYGFASGERIWYSQVEPGGRSELEGSGCMTPGGEFCEEIVFWPGFNE